MLLTADRPTTSRWTPLCGANAPIRSDRSLEGTNRGRHFVSKTPSPGSQIALESGLGSAFEPTPAVARADSTSEHRDRSARLRRSRPARASPRIRAPAPARVDARFCPTQRRASDARNQRQAGSPIWAGVRRQPPGVAHVCFLANALVSVLVPVGPWRLSPSPPNPSARTVTKCARRGTASSPRGSLPRTSRRFVPLCSRRSSRDRRLLGAQSGAASVRDRGSGRSALGLPTAPVRGRQFPRRGPPLSPLDDVSVTRIYTAHGGTLRGCARASTSSSRAVLLRPGGAFSSGSARCARVCSAGRDRSRGRPGARRAGVLWLPSAGRRGSRRCPGGRRLSW